MRSAAARLDAESRAWLGQLQGEGPIRDAAIGRLHALLVQEARYEVRRRTAALVHPSGRDLDDLATQAADDAVVALLAKLDDFRGDARFTTWARRFAALEVPGKLRRRLGHTRETPNDGDGWLAVSSSSEDPSRVTEAGELARTVGHLIADSLTPHQREVLLELAINEVPTAQLALRLHCTPGALYKTLHDARAKLRQQLAEHEGDETPARGGLASASPSHPVACAPVVAR
ncbi:MAG TPA: sigma-70 family RNA polymerase sigma factor [Solirubrobacteraceae bacterium]|nr:sigma-70 family RNA polymerase sigma factor [Solirubrobacteraceae bacterium]